MNSELTYGTWENQGATEVFPSGHSGSILFDPSDRNYMRELETVELDKGRRLASQACVYVENMSAVGNY